MAQTKRKRVNAEQKHKKVILDLKTFMKMFLDEARKLRNYDKALSFYRQIQDATKGVAHLLAEATGACGAICEECNNGHLCDGDCKCGLCSPLLTPQPTSTQPTSKKEIDVSTKTCQTCDAGKQCSVACGCDRCGQKC